MTTTPKWPIPPPPDCYVDPASDIACYKACKELFDFFGDMCGPEIDAANVAVSNLMDHLEDTCVECEQEAEKENPGSVAERRAEADHISKHKCKGAGCPDYEYPDDESFWHSWLSPLSETPQKWR